MSLSMNQFKQIPVKGQLDLRVNPSIISCQIGPAEAGTLVPGQPVTMVDSADGVPKVVAAAADTADVFGFLVYDIKQQTFVAGDRVEVAMFRGNVMVMEAASAIARNAQVGIVVAGQKVQTAASGDRIIGRALDKAAADGDLIRVIIDLPGELVP